MLLSVSNQFPPSNNSPCSVLWSGSNDWLYDGSGLERRPLFYNPVLSVPGNWARGASPLGIGPGPCKNLFSKDAFTLLGFFHFLAFSLGATNQLRTVIKNPPSSSITTYFRRTVKFLDSACYSSLVVELVVNDGIIFYLNNVEALRVNLPLTESITNGTLVWFHLFSNKRKNHFNNFFLLFDFSCLPLNRQTH